MNGQSLGWRVESSRTWLIALLLIAASLPVAAAPTDKELTNSIGMKLVAIPAGEFVMGAPADEVAQETKSKEKGASNKTKNNPDREEAHLAKLEGTTELLESQLPQHRVTISKSFLLGMHEVTQQEFAAVMGFNPSTFAKGGVAQEKVAGLDTRRHPVESVSWEDAAEFCRQLSALPAEAAAGRTYRLPTEAEWEYACRAGTTTRYYWGDRGAMEVRKKQEYLPLTATSGKVPHPVGGKEPNPWGLYDMLGNVSEWCADWYDPQAYAKSAPRDPVGPAEGKEKVVRGGTVIWQVVRMRSSFRRKNPPESRIRFVGFRVVCEVRGDVSPVVPLASFETQLKSKGLVKSGSFFVVPEEPEFIRFVTALQRLRAACYAAQNECHEADQQIVLAKSAKGAAIASRIEARSYISYSSTWREHWNGVRARRNAKDAIALAELSTEGLQQWRQEAQQDLEIALVRFDQQVEKLRGLLGELQAKTSKLAADPEVQAALAAANKSGTIAFRFGPSASLTAAIKKLDHETSQVSQVRSK